MTGHLYYGKKRNLFIRNSDEQRNNNLLKEKLDMSVFADKSNVERSLRLTMLFFYIII